MIGDPLTLLAAVVAIEHGGHRIHSKPVDVILAKPEQSVRDQEVPHLVTRVVEDQRAPVGVLAQAGILVLVEGRAVEASQREVVPGKMGGNPVEQHPDAVLVAQIHEEAEVVRIPVARRRRVVAAHLVAPGAVERILGDRQQLEVGEAVAL